MVNRIAYLFVMVLSACTAGPSRPHLDDYNAPAVAIRVHFLDLPDGEVQYAQLEASWAHHIGSTVQELTAQQIPAGGASQKFLAPDVQLILQVASTVDSMATNHTVLPDLRFFALSAFVSSPPKSQTDDYHPDPAMWRQPGLLLAYATQATEWRPFGPVGGTMAFAPGYSWLKRTCGAVPGEIQMAVRPIAETVQFRRVSQGYASIDIEGWEEAFATSCGVTGPTKDMGTRLFFDRAQELAWAPDDTSLYYLSVADAEDSTASVALRQVRVADSLASEFAIIPHGSSLQVDKTGEVFLHDNQALLTVAPTTPTVLARSLPNPAVVSPDGRWIAHSYGDYTQSPTFVWDTAAGADLTHLDGDFAGWSPDAQLAYWSSPDQPKVLSTFSPAGPGGNPTTYPYVVDQRSKVSLVWGSTGPLLAKCSIVTDGGACAGLSLVDPAMGFERQVLDPSAGVIGESFTSSLNVMVVWVTKCSGLFDTLCSSTLFRIDLLDATAQTVAVSSETGPVALSSDGQRIAIGAADGIYVKNLP